MRLHKERLLLDSLPRLALPTDDFDILPDTQTFKSRLLSLIAEAKQRIYLCALYLQNDDGGKEILTALYQAKQQNPALEVKVFVDFHRAQRGLIGEEKQAGNAQYYKECQAKAEHPIEIYGVPVKSRELLGVLHLKGFVFDDTVLFSGASLNDIYLHQGERYRYDRYHVLRQKQLADSMAHFLECYFVNAEAVRCLTDEHIPTVKEMKRDVLALKRSLLHANYQFTNMPVAHSGVGITPLVGLGFRRNELNQTIRAMIRTTDEKLVILTPYFNPPPVLVRDLRKLLKKGRSVTIVIGDKTANDFYIPPDQPFSKIGGLPYIYETYLRRFIQTQPEICQQRPAQCALCGSHDNNSFHLKGISCDDQVAPDHRQ